MEKLVTSHSAGRVTTIKLNRPHKLNALNVALVEQLREALNSFARSENRVAVLHGEGRSFSVGADLNDNPLDLWRAVPGLGVQIDRPIVAAVHGHCIGGAFVLAMYADLVVAGEGTVFSYPEAKVGFTGGIAAGLAVRVPHKVAMEFLLLGERMSARRAYEVGIVNRVTSAGEHLNVANEWAATLAAGAPRVISALKAFAGATVPVSPAEQAAHARRVLWEVHNSADRAEGEAAFAEKRPPLFAGS